MRRSSRFPTLGLVTATLFASQPAWASVVIPEPGGLTLLALAVVGGFALHQLRK